MAQDLATRDEALRTVGSPAASDAGRRVARAEDAVDRDARLPRDAAHVGGRPRRRDARALLRNDRARDAAARSHRPGPARSGAARERRRHARRAMCSRSGGCSSTSPRATSTKRRRRIAVRATSRTKRTRSSADPDPHRAGDRESVGERAAPHAGRRRIELSARADATPSCCRSIDSGAGIAAEHCPTCSTASTRSMRRARTDSGGSGLGLSITKAIVDRHGGSIRSAVPDAPRSPSSCPSREDAPSHSTSTNL